MRSWPVILSKGSHALLAASLLIAVLSAAAVLAIRSATLLEAVELIAYDLYIRWRPVQPSGPARVALVLATEQELKAYHYPLSDDILARAIRVIASAGARAIG